MYAGVLHVHGDVRVVIDDVSDLGEPVLGDGCAHLADSTGSRSSGRVAMAYDYLCRKQLGLESDSDGRVQRRWVGAFVGGAFGVIDKTIRQLGAYMQSVKDANQRIEII